MAPKKRSATSAEDLLKTELETDKPKEETIALGDTHSLKRALDDAVAGVLHDEGHLVDHTYTDVKIWLGVLSCAVALLAQFYPKKHPETFWILVMCVSIYVLLSTLMTVVAAVFEKEAIVVTRGDPGRLPALVISSKLPRFEDTYSLRIAPRGAPGATSSSGGSAGGAVCLAKSVGAYFHSDGHLAADAIRADVKQLLQQFLEAKGK